MADEELTEEEEVEPVEEEESLPEEDETSEETDDTLPTKESSEKTEEDKTEETEPEGYVKKERLDNMMSSYQEALRDKKLLEDENTKFKTTQTKDKNQEDKWFDYLSNKMEAKASEKRKAEDRAAADELKEVLTENPKLKQDALLEIALKYKVNLRTSADILKDINLSRETGKKLTEGEIKRKKLAGKIGGKAGVTQKKGLSTYDPKLSFEDNIQKGYEELGMK